MQHVFHTRLTSHFQMRCCWWILTLVRQFTAGGWQKDQKHGLGRKVYATGDVYEVSRQHLAEDFTHLQIALDIVHSQQILAACVKLSFYLNRVCGRLESQRDRDVTAGPTAMSMTASGVSAACTGRAPSNGPQVWAWPSS